MLSRSAVVESLGKELAVVHHVVVRKHHAFGQAGGAAGVLDVGDIFDGDMIGQLAVQHRGGRAIPASRSRWCAAVRA